MWVLSLGEGAWSHLPSVGSGLLGMFVGGILQPEAQGVSGLLLFGMVALEEVGGGRGGSSTVWHNVRWLYVRWRGRCGRGEPYHHARPSAGGRWAARTTKSHQSPMS